MSVDNCNKIASMVKELSPIVEQTPMDQEKFNEFMTKYKLGKIESKINNIGFCMNNAVNIGDNTITVPRECVTTIEKACRAEVERDGGNYQECYKKYRPSIRNVTQTNIVNVEQTCNIRSLLSDAAVQKNEQLALTLKLLLGNANISCEKGVNNSLSFLNRDLNSIGVLNSCLNESYLIQSNKLDACYSTGVFQKNIANIIQNCSINSDVINESIISEQNQNPEQEQEQEQPSSPSSPSSSQKIKFNPSKFKKNIGGNSNSNNTIIIIVIAIVCMIVFCFLSLMFIM